MKKIINFITIFAVIFALGSITLCIYEGLVPVDVLAQRVGRMGVLIVDPNGDDQFVQSIDFQNTSIEVGSLADVTIDLSISTDSINFAIDDATNDTYVVTIGSIGAYTAGLFVYFDANNPNVGACTLNVNSLGAKALKSLHNQDPANDYIEARSVVHCVYDGTSFQILSPDANP